MSMKEYTKITPEVYERVRGRDGGCCIICGRRDIQCAHYIPRSQGGMGIPQNLVMLCVEHHTLYDNGGMREELGEVIKDYLKGWYSDWNKEELKYDKWGWTHEASGETEA